jgi:hypothetical protein
LLSDRPFVAAQAAANAYLLLNLIQPLSRAASPAPREFLGHGLSRQRAWR